MKDIKLLIGILVFMVVISSSVYGDVIKSNLVWQNHFYSTTLTWATISASKTSEDHFICMNAPIGENLTAGSTLFIKSYFESINNDKLGHVSAWLVPFQDGVPVINQPLGRDYGFWYQYLGRFNSDVWGSSERPIIKSPRWSWTNNYLEVTHNTGTKTVSIFTDDNSNLQLNFELISGSMYIKIFDGNTTSTQLLSKSISSTGHEITLNFGVQKNHYYTLQFVPSSSNSNIHVNISSGGTLYVLYQQVINPITYQASSVYFQIPTVDYTGQYTLCFSIMGDVKYGISSGSNEQGYWEYNGVNWQLIGGKSLYISTNISVGSPRWNPIVQYYFPLNAQGWSGVSWLQKGWVGFETSTTALSPVFTVTHDGVYLVRFRYTYQYDGSRSKIFLRRYTSSGSEDITIEQDSWDRGTSEVSISQFSGQVNIHNLLVDYNTNYGIYSYTQYAYVPIWLTAGNYSFGISAGTYTRHSRLGGIALFDAGGNALPEGQFKQLYYQNGQLVARITTYLNQPISHDTIICNINYEDGSSQTGVMTDNGDGTYTLGLQSNLGFIAVCNSQLTGDSKQYVTHKQITPSLITPYYSTITSWQLCLNLYDVYGSKLSPNSVTVWISGDLSGELGYDFTTKRWCSEFPPSTANELNVTLHYSKIGYDSGSVNYTLHKADAYLNYQVFDSVYGTTIPSVLKIGQDTLTFDNSNAIIIYPSGTYNYEVASEGYSTQTGTITIPPNSTAELKVFLNTTQKVVTGSNNLLIQTAVGSEACGVVQTSTATCQVYLSDDNKTWDLIKTVTTQYDPNEIQTISTTTYADVEDSNMIYNDLFAQDTNIASFTDIKDQFAHGFARPYPVFWETADYMGEKADMLKFVSMGKGVNMLYLITENGKVKPDPISAKIYYKNAGDTFGNAGTPVIPMNPYGQVDYATPFEMSVKVPDGISISDASVTYSVEVSGLLRKIANGVYSEANSRNWTIVLLLPYKDGSQIKWESIEATSRNGTISTQKYDGYASLSDLINSRGYPSTYLANRTDITNWLLGAEATNLYATPFTLDSDKLIIRGYIFIDLPTSGEFHVYGHNEVKGGFKYDIPQYTEKGVMIGDYSNKTSLHGSDVEVWSKSECSGATCGLQFIQSKYMMGIRTGLMLKPVISMTTQTLPHSEASVKVPDGYIKVDCTTPEYESVGYTHLNHQDSTISLYFAPTSMVTTRFRVVDKVGNPIHSATVRVSGVSSQLTDWNGVATFTLTQNRDYDVTVEYLNNKNSYNIHIGDAFNSQGIGKGGTCQSFDGYYFPIVFNPDLTPVEFYGMYGSETVGKLNVKVTYNGDVFHANGDKYVWLNVPRIDNTLTVTASSEYCNGTYTTTFNPAYDTQVKIPMDSCVLPKKEENKTSSGGTFVPAGSGMLGWLTPTTMGLLILVIMSGFAGYKAGLTGLIVTLGAGAVLLWFGGFLSTSVLAVVMVIVALIGANNLRSLVSG